MDPNTFAIYEYKRILAKENLPKLEFLALQILISRLKITVKINNNPETIDHCAEELKAMLIKCWNNPKVQNDLKRLIEHEG